MLALANGVVVPGAYAQSAQQVGEEVLRGVFGANQPQRQVQLPPATLRMDPTDQRRYDAANAAYEKTVVQGAVLGGVLGAVICKVAADADEKVLLACGVGGAVLGGVLGDKVGKKSKELIQDREKVDSALADAKANRASAQELLDATNKNIAYLESQVKSYNTKYQAGTISHAQYQSEMQAARGHLDTLNEGVEKVNDQMKKQKKLFEKIEKHAGKSEDPDIIAVSGDITKEKEATIGFLEGETAVTASKITTVEGMLGA